jgi:hypothetical protein
MSLGTIACDTAKLDLETILEEMRERRKGTIAQRRQLEDTVKLLANVKRVLS